MKLPFAFCFPFLGLPLLFATLVLARPASGQSYGLDTLQPIGKYLDNKLPATTPGTNGVAQPPALLSQVGAFSNLATLTPRAGLIPYTVNSPLWTDGAEKRRWLAIPNDGTADTAAEKISFSETGNWQFPTGAVLVKEFDLPVDDRNPAVLRRMETRFLVHGEDGVYYGVTYRWRADGSDADLLPDGDSVSVPITTASGGTRSQTWSFPSRSDCRSCHNAGAGRVLGARTHQLNGDYTYAATGRTDNQLRVLNHLNLLSPALSESAIPSYPKSVPLTDTNASLEQRVRSYLDSNCAHCHYPANPLNLSAGFDTRLATPLAQQNIINGSVLYDLGLANARIVAPQSTSNSVMHRRISINGLHQMPPIGRNTVDTLAVSTLAAWINALPIEPPPTANRSPLAGNDEVSTPLNTAVEITVLANDSDPDGDPLNVSSATVPTSGTVTALAGNRYRFAPTTGFTGTSSFQYTVIDGKGGSATATVAIRVLPPATSNSIAFIDGTSRLSAPTSYSGVAMGVADMNSDGRDDVVHLQAARQLRVEYQTAGGGNFTGKDLGTTTTGNQWAIGIADADNNGFPDILVGGYYDGLKYYRAASGGESYSLTTLSTPSIFSQATAFVDINRDGWLDVFACHDDGECAKFRNTGNGTLVADASLINARTLTPSDNSGNYGIVWSDYDNDGDVDLYLSKCRLVATSMTDPRRINQLFRNNGNGTFTDVGPAAGMAFGEQSWVADFGDIDNDGDMDCYVGNHGAMSYMMRNNGNGTFSDITASAGMSSVTWRAIQTIFRDFNNDGFTDLLLTGERQELWMNNRNSTFTLITNPFITDIMESAAVGDLNQDGFTDIYAGYAAIYNGPVSARPDKVFLAQPNGNQFLSVRLKGVASNTNGVGARVELHGPWGQQSRDVRGGEGYGVTHSFTQIFGMGNAASATRLRVRWPSGAVDEALNVLPNQFLTLREGSTAAPSLTSPVAQSHFRGSSVNLALVASDPTGDALVYSATGLPQGVSINATTGVISGTIAATALSNYTTIVSVTDGWSSVSRSFAWTINGYSAPGASLTTTSGSVSGPFDVKVIFTASVTGLAAGDFAITNGSVTTLTGSGAVYQIRITPTASGWVNISLPANRVTATLGGLGNTASNSLPVNFLPPDTTRPSVTLTTPLSTVTGAFTVTATFSESVSGLSSGEFTVSNGTASAPIGSGTTYTVTITPNTFGTITVSLPANVANDAAGNLNTASNAITVSWPQPNRAPVITSPGNQSTVRGAVVSLQVAGSDPDGQSLTWSATNLPQGLAIQSSTGAISGTVSSTANEAYNTSISATDGALAASINFTWTTTVPAPANGLKGEYFAGTTPGIAAPLLTRTDANIQFDWGNGSPSPAVPNDLFSARWTGFLTAPFTETYEVWVPSDNGVRVWVNNQLMLDKWTPQDITGWHHFTLPLTANQAVAIRVEYAELYGGANITLFWYSASMPWEAMANRRFTVAPAVNRTPVISAPVAQTSVRTRPATLQLSGSDPDMDALTWSATGLPAGLTLNSATGFISGTIAANAAAANSVAVTVSDGALTANATFSWTTTAPPQNRAPVVFTPATQTSIRGSIVTFNAVANDPDEDALVWSASGLPAGLSIHTTTGLISGTVLLSAGTTSAVTITVTDPGNLTASATFTWNTTSPPLNGLRGEYFSGTTPGVGAPLLTRTDPTINFDWGGGSPDASVPNDLFSARWTGSLTALYTETHSFWVPSDNGVRIWINNQLVLDKWTPQDISGWHNFNLALTANQPVPIRIEYAELYGGAALTVFWFSNSQPWEAISTQRFTPSVNLPPGSALEAAAMIRNSQQVLVDPQVGSCFLFRRPSSSAALLSLVVEQSSDLRHWEINDSAPLVYQNQDGTDDIMLIIPTPGTAAAPTNCYFRVRMLVPDQTAAP